jgi:hypothetical protein
MKNAIFITLSALLFSGCAHLKLGSNYHPRDGTHGLGYSETRIGSNLWRVMYRGYYIPESQSYDFALLRAAQVVRAAGFKFFSVEDERATSTNQAGVGMLSTTGSLAFGGAVMGGYPEVSLIVRGLNSKAGASAGGRVYDADFIFSELSQKYRVKLPIQRRSP